MRLDQAQLLWMEVCGPRLRKLGHEKDQNLFIWRLFDSFAKFTNIQESLPFVEMVRHALKKRAKRSQANGDFTILKEMLQAHECYQSIRNG